MTLYNCRWHMIRKTFTKINLSWTAVKGPPPPPPPGTVMMRMRNLTMFTVSRGETTAAGITVIRWTGQLWPLKLLRRTTLPTRHSNHLRQGTVRNDIVVSPKRSINIPSSMGMDYRSVGACLQLGHTKLILCFTDCLGLKHDPVGR